MSVAPAAPIHRRFLTVATALVAAACGPGASQPEPAAAPAPLLERDVVTPVSRPVSDGDLHAFAIAPWHYDRVECRFVRQTPTGAVIETAFYPSFADAQVSLSLTYDSTGHLVRSGETHGVFRFRPPAGDISKAVRDSALRAQSQGLRQTLISLDYLVDPGLLVRRDSGMTTRTLAVSTRGVGDLPVLDRPAEHAREAARACPPGARGLRAASPPSASGG
ncbi:MAG: hypothetical protein KGL93_06340 [Gemmatimonadota bacterium]|nr:hypothetical protein [Gemmatimonadota bacterium]